MKIKKVGTSLYQSTEEAVVGEIGPNERILVFVGGKRKATRLHRDQAPALNVKLYGRSIWLVFPMTLPHAKVVEEALKSLKGAHHVLLLCMLYKSLCLELKGVYF